MSGSSLAASEAISIAASELAIPVERLTALLEKNLLEFLTTNPQANSVAGVQALLQGDDVETRAGQEWTWPGEDSVVDEKSPIRRRYPYIIPLASHIPALKSEVLSRFKINELNHSAVSRDLGNYMVHLEAYVIENLLRCYDYLFDTEGNIHEFIARPIRTWLAGHPIAGDKIEFYLTHPEFKKNLLRMLLVNVKSYQQNRLCDPSADLPGAELIATSSANETRILRPFLSASLTAFNRATFDKIVRTIRVLPEPDGSANPLLAELTPKVDELHALHVDYVKAAVSDKAQKRSTLDNKITGLKINEILTNAGVENKAIEQFLARNPDDYAEANIYSLLRRDDPGQRQAKLAEYLRDMFLHILVLKDNEDFYNALENQLKLFREDRELIGKLNPSHNAFKLVPVLNGTNLEQGLEYQQTLLDLARLYIENCKKRDASTQQDLQYEFMAAYLEKQFYQIDKIAMTEANAIASAVNNVALNAESLISALRVLQAMQLFGLPQFAETKAVLTELALSHGVGDHTAFEGKINEFKAQCVVILLQVLVGRADTTGAAVSRFNHLLAELPLDDSAKIQFSEQAIIILSQKGAELEKQSEDLYQLEVRMIATLPEITKKRALINCVQGRVYSVPVTPEQDKLAERLEFLEKLISSLDSVAFPSALIDEVKKTIEESLTSEILIIDVQHLPQLRAANYTEAAKADALATDAVDTVTLTTAQLSVNSADYTAHIDQYRYLEGWCEKNHIRNLLAGGDQMLDFRGLKIACESVINITDNSDGPKEFEQVFTIKSAMRNGQEYFLDATVTVTCQITSTGTRLTTMTIEGRDRELMQYLLTTEPVAAERIEAFVSEGTLKPKLNIGGILIAMQNESLFTNGVGVVFRSQLSDLKDSSDDNSRRLQIAEWNDQRTHEGRETTQLEHRLRTELDKANDDSGQLGSLLVCALAAVALQPPLIRAELQRLFFNPQLTVKEFPEILTHLTWVFCTWLLAPSAKAIIAVRLKEFFAKLPTDREKLRKILLTLIDSLQVIGSADDALVASIKTFSGSISKPGETSPNEAKLQKYFEGLKAIVQILLTKEPEGENNPESRANQVNQLIRELLAPRRSSLSETFANLTGRTTPPRPSNASVFALGTMRPASAASPGLPKTSPSSDRTSPAASPLIYAGGNAHKSSAPASLHSASAASSSREVELPSVGFTK